jgi:N-acyl-D-aspartate/D-glutamate deacylase
MREEDVMAYDLVIRNGMILDGSGFARYRADIGIAGDTIVDIGQMRGAAAQTIDAEGLFVALGGMRGMHEPRVVSS